MQVCKTVKLRMRDRRNGTKSLFLDFWPGYRDPETMELIRRLLSIWKKKRLLLRKKSNITIEDDNLSHSIKDSHFVGCLFLMH